MKDLQKGLNVLSLFDGMACGRYALERAGIPVANYFASEIDNYAIDVAKNNWPDIVHLGDVTLWPFWDWDNMPVFDLIIGGSPCQGFSFAGKRLNLEDPRSKLFFVYEQILKETRRRNPDVKYLLENTPMHKDSENIITERIEVEPVKLNSRLTSAQNRKRLYWTNWDITPPEDAGILLKDIVLPDTFPVALHNLYGGFKEKGVRVFIEKSPTLRTSAGGGHIPSFITRDLLHSEKAIAYMDRKVKDGRTHWDFMHHSDIRNDKSACIVANFFKGVPYNVFKDWGVIRKFHPVECERLQSLPDNCTAIGASGRPISPTQRYKMTGNGWEIGMLAHIFKCIKE